ncbi:rnd efflux pump membrane fusion protein barrel-sandwich domain [Lucifera butyrica]|uniref:Rnd efflux pump membrane fusion protein barrel-sandwich domain n=1 Tax=Lucifera butyrica TaxID=1351585 RepID=A0A498R470_9FIRM|nr:HlyD family secretion protein [Lucifera butyrica]VBB05062.1 rnd efflux pump membrane fusion protein barrel-sandwich domain [Lucifera butyrica]
MPENNGKQKRIVFVAALFVLVGLAGGGWWWYQSTKYVNTDDARVSGTIVSVSAKIPGRVSEVLVKEGDQVKEGQVVARLDPRDVQAQKDKANAALAVARARYDEALAGSRPQEIAAARAELAQADASFDNTYKNYTRMEKLYRDGAISSSQRDSAETAYLVAKDTANAVRQKLDLAVTGSRDEDIRAAAAQVKQAQAELEAANLDTEYTSITSPVTGVVAQKSVNAGEMVAAGQTLFSVVDSQDLWLNARIEETKIGQIKVGQPVDYTIDGYPGRTFTGQVLEIGSATNSTFALVPTENTSGNFTKVTQRIPIKISLPQDSGVVFRPGMQAVIDIHLK